MPRQRDVGHGGLPFAPSSPAGLKASKFCVNGHGEGHGFLTGQTHDEHRWRDLFPLPAIPDSRAVRQSACSSHGSRSVKATRNLHRRQHNLQVANSVIHAANQMYGCVAPVAADPPTAAQAEAQNSILNAVVLNENSSSCKPQLEAVHELLRSGHSYVSAELAPTTVRAYDRSRVSIPQVGACVPQAADIIDDLGREILLNPSRMFADFDSLGSCFDNANPVKPYMDETLRNNPIAYANFVADLYERKMISFRCKAKSIVTPLLVIKKDGRLRLVLDCRATNRLFAPSPDIALAAGYSYSQLELPAEQCLYVAQSDLKD